MFLSAENERCLGGKNLEEDELAMFGIWTTNFPDTLIAMWVMYVSLLSFCLPCSLSSFASYFF